MCSKINFEKIKKVICFADKYIMPVANMATSTILLVNTIKKLVYKIKSKRIEAVVVGNHIDGKRFYPLYRFVYKDSVVVLASPVGIKKPLEIGTTETIYYNFDTEELLRQKDLDSSGLEILVTAFTSIDTAYRIYRNNNNNNSDCEKTI